jgi:hypothetical protein
MASHDDLGYVPQVKFRDPFLDEMEGWHRIRGLDLGYAAVYLVVCDEGCLHLAAVSDEYGVTAVEWSDVADQATNLSPGVDTT